MANSSLFISTPFLDYFTVSNDYSLLSLAFYMNILLNIFNRTNMLRQLEFSVYPQKLLSILNNYQIIPIKVLL